MIGGCSNIWALEMDMAMLEYYSCYECGTPYCWGGQDCKAFIGPRKEPLLICVSTPNGNSSFYSKFLKQSLETS